MTARILALPAILISMFAVAGCFGPSEPEQAPPPRAKRTTAELLVGTWEMIESDPSVSADGSSTIECTADGRWSSRTIAEAGDEPQLASGTYVLEGDIIRMTLLSANKLRGNDRLGKSWERLIESISETERVSLGPPSSEGKRTRAVYRRVTPK